MSFFDPSQFKPYEQNENSETLLHIYMTGLILF